MIDKLKNIINLSKLYIKENDLSLKIINMKTRRFNKKSVLFWVYVILFFGAFYISSEVVQYTKNIGKPEIFLNGFLLFAEILVIISNYKDCSCKYECVLFFKRYGKCATSANKTN